MTSLSRFSLSEPLSLKEEESFELFSSSPPSSTLTSHHITLLKRKEAIISSYPSTPTERTSLQNRVIFLSKKDQTPSPPIILRSALKIEECVSLLDSIMEYTQDHGWMRERHSAFQTTDIPVRDLPEQVKEWVERIIWERVVRDEISRRYGFHPTGRDLAFRDLFVVRYLAALGSQRSLSLHTDGALLSFNILLNSPDEFEGGGTFLEGDGPCILRGTRGSVMQLGRGDAVVHESKRRHAGIEITKGERVLLVGFVDTVCRIERDELLKKI